MRTFDYSFMVRASISAVADFHRDTRALRRLTPPPVFVQLHCVEPMAEGSISKFTLWFGPLPIYWTAQHSKIDTLHGFTDTQICGPMKNWVHTHAFSDDTPKLTCITEHIEYDHYDGVQGLISRLLFTPIGLKMTFFYRNFVTRRLLERSLKNTVRMDDTNAKT